MKTINLKLKFKTKEELESFRQTIITAIEQTSYSIEFGDSDESGKSSLDNLNEILNSLTK